MREHLPRVQDRGRRQASDTRRRTCSATSRAVNCAAGLLPRRLARCESASSAFFFDSDSPAAISRSSTRGRPLNLAAAPPWPWLSPRTGDSESSSLGLKVHSWL